MITTISLIDIDEYICFSPHNEEGSNKYFHHNLIVMMHRYVRSGLCMQMNIWMLKRISIDNSEFFLHR